MKAHIFNPIDPISIIEFFSTFKMECDTKGVRERVVLWLFPWFLNNPEAAALLPCSPLKSKSSHHSVKERVLTTYFQIVNPLFEAYVMEDGITGAYSQIPPYVKAPTISPLELVNEPWVRSTRCPHLHDAYVLRGILFEALLESGWHSRRAYWNSQNTLLFPKLANQAALQKKLQAAASPKKHPALYTNNRNKSNNCQSNRGRETIHNIGASSTT